MNDQGWVSNRLPESYPQHNRTDFWSIAEITTSKEESKIIQSCRLYPELRISSIFRKIVENQANGQEYGDTCRYGEDRVEKSHLVNIGATYYFK